MHEGQFCDWQGYDDEGVYCTAHIAEDRVLNCPFKTVEDIGRIRYPCSDYRPVTHERVKTLQEVPDESV